MIQPLSPIMKLIRSGYIQQKMHEGYSQAEADKLFDKMRTKKVKDANRSRP